MPSPDLRNDKTVGTWLGSANALLRRAHLLATINHSLPRWCDEAWVRHIRVANLRGDVLVIYSTSGAALVPLRSRHSDLLDYLRDRFGLHCTQIEAKTRPEPPT